MNLNRRIFLFEMPTPEIEEMLFGKFTTLLDMLEYLKGLECNGEK